MRTISQQDLDTLCEKGKAIDCKGGYPAVVIHPDDTITKIWARRRSFWSSSTLWPYSNRFVSHAKELERRGVAVPEMIDHATVEGSHIRIVTYRSLAGQSVRECLRNAPGEVSISGLSRFIHWLHQKGILFRAMHLGNVIRRPDDLGYGLIDFTDVRFYSRPVPILRRAANLATPLRYREDVKSIKEAGHPGLQESYLGILKLDESKERRFRAEVERHLK